MFNNKINNSVLFSKWFWRHNKFIYITITVIMMPARSPRYVVYPRINQGHLLESGQRHKTSWDLVKTEVAEVVKSQL